MPLICSIHYLSENSSSRRITRLSTTRPWTRSLNMLSYTRKLSSRSGTTNHL
jgi:hypothetical protein